MSATLFYIGLVMLGAHYVMWWFIKGEVKRGITHFPLAFILASVIAYFTGV